MFKITFKKSVAKDLKRISKDQVNKILDKIEINLSTAPEQYPELKGKFAGLRKFRVGNYRQAVTKLAHRQKFSMVNVYKFKQSSQSPFFKEI